MKFALLQEQQYEEQMTQTVEPGLAARAVSFQLQRTPGQKIHCDRYLAQKPTGVILIAHGFTESAEKYKELAWYFLQTGFHVYLIEHCGHGRSYRLTKDPSLVHVDRWQTYAEDLLFIAETIGHRHPGLPLYLFGHSMGGGISAAALQFPKAAKLFQKVILSSPMILPDTGSVPLWLTRIIARLMCRIGKGERYVPGHHPYAGEENFADSCSTSQARFSYYQKKRMTEPKFQTNGASYSWLYQSLLMKDFLLADTAELPNLPVFLLQAGKDTTVSNPAQLQYIQRLPKGQYTEFSQAKHEIFNSTNDVLGSYLAEILTFLTDRLFSFDGQNLSDSDQ